MKTTSNLLFEYHWPSWGWEGEESDGATAFVSTRNARCAAWDPKLPASSWVETWTYQSPSSKGPKERRFSFVKSPARGPGTLAGSWSAKI